MTLTLNLGYKFMINEVQNFMIICNFALSSFSLLIVVLHYLLEG